MVRKNKFASVVPPAGNQTQDGSYQFWSDGVQRARRKKSPEADLKHSYGKRLEIGFIMTLVLLIVAFQLARRFQIKPKKIADVNLVIEAEDIPATEQFRKPPPPPRPSLPVPSESDDVPEDLTIESTNLDLGNVPPPPPPPDEDESTLFVAYDEAPRIVGGLGALSSKLVYPPIARKSGAECSIVAKVLVDKNGHSRKVDILRCSQPGMNFENSAIAAIMSLKWYPARQRDRAVTTWVAIPVGFRLAE